MLTSDWFVTKFCIILRAGEINASRETKGPWKRSQHCWPTRRNIVELNMLRAFAHHVMCCCVLLRLVWSCWMKFETGQTSEATSANISIVSRSSKRGPTMLGWKWYMNYFIYWTANLKSRELWSSQLWSQFKQLRIEAWKAVEVLTFSGFYTQLLKLRS